jgi:hypothetical protein
LASGILLFSFASSAFAVDQSKQTKVRKQVWVVVTHPMMSCSAPDDDVSIRQTLFDVFAHPPAAGKLPEGCVPSMTPVYAPPRRLVGIYLRPIKPPKGW